MINSMEILMIVLRSVASIIVLYLVTRMLGKKQLSQLTIYDYIVGITIGSIAADSILSLDNTDFANGLISILTFGFLALLISYLAIKDETANKLLNGEPLVLIESGEFNFDNLRKAKLTIHKFLEEARLKGFYDLSLINYAILETNGQISFLPKEQYQYSTLNDFKTEVKKKSDKQTFCNNIIVDGQIQYEILKDLNKDDKWLQKELKKLKINDVNNILLATIDQKGQIRIFKELM